ncbi:MAG TPA: guanylate kinase [Elusimicrobia bacterium]|nr:MAG: guanylate kinase [Elusimicrobia bacterium GWA2_64_40]OGR66810.1 MAG: guanylate kinase [Elusimicrobia bacterium GWB2_63_16]HAN04834.1 guanylate kinase [Elusimicrobiota bacterium]HAU89047.1 guanylate kinase [Elusimicrobiota bacterium]
MVLSAPSGGGKTVVRSGLLKLNRKFAFSVTCTTRSRRPGEVEGKDYFFVTIPQFLKLREEGKLLEWAKVHGNYYGTPVKSVMAVLEKGRIPVMTIDVKGARSVKKIFPEAVTVFLLPPDLKTLVQRLRGRGEAPENVAVRLETARSEIKVASGFDYLVINDRLPETIREVAAIAELETLKTARNLDKVRSFGTQLSRKDF